MILTKVVNLTSNDIITLIPEAHATAEETKKRFEDMGSNCICYILSNGTMLCIDFLGPNDGVDAYLYF